MFSLLSLLDDVATTLDDVSVMTKIAIKKTSVLMSDDLAVNAGVVTGANPDRELPIVKAIFYGSLLNKVYCIGGVLILMAVYPPLLTAILLIGGLYLCYEGAHKTSEKILPGHEEEKRERALPEKEKIKGAVRTDLILSIEIIVIAKNSITGPFLNQTMTLIAVGLAASVLIYGMVALLVKIDDFGLFLIKRGRQKTGLALVRAMPYTMRGLGVVGTLAMFLVGGGIVSHTFHLKLLPIETLQNLLLGIVAGIICLGAVRFLQKAKASAQG